MKTARPYQICALDGGDERGRGCFKEWEEHISTLINLPTGAGKTFVAGEIIKRQLGRTLFVVHLREIVLQAGRELRGMTGMSVATELGGSRESQLSPEPIVVSSVQTMGNRLDKFDPNEFTLLIFDEGHHGIAKSWQKIGTYFKQNPNLRILFLSATPERTDKQALKLVCESVAYAYPLRDCVNDGWLVKPRQLIVDVPELDISQIATKNGVNGRDLDPEQLDRAMRNDKVLHKSTMAALEAMFGLYPRELYDTPQDRWSNYLEGKESKRTLGFCPSVEHSEIFSSMLNYVRPGLSDWVCGETEHDLRKNKFKAFYDGRTPSLMNFGVTVEGYDNPFVQVVLMLRLTESIPLFTQCIGRGTRTWPGTIDGLNTVADRWGAIANSPKPYVTIVNFHGKNGKHKLVTSLDLLGGEMKPHVHHELIKRAEQGAIDIEAEREIVDEENRQREVEKRSHLLTKTNYDSYESDIFTGRKKKKKTKLTPEQKAARANRPLSEKQLDQLRQQKLNPERRTMEENKQLLKTMQYRRLAGLCTYRQGFVLAKHGYTKNEIEKMKFREASSAIDAIANNGWKRPKATEPSFTDSLIRDSAERYDDSFGAPAF